MGDPHRFPEAAAFKRFTGLTPKASETGDTDRKGQAISKAGPRRLRDQLVQSANTARRVDPQLAAVYFTQMVERGAHHQKAVCIVAARLAERAWVVMSRAEPYVIRDVDGTPVSPAEAHAIIEEHYRCPEDVRRRRRSRKSARKAPHQVLKAHASGQTRHRVDSRGDLPRTATKADTAPMIKTPPHHPGNVPLTPLDNQSRIGSQTCRLHPPACRTCISSRHEPSRAARPPACAQPTPTTLPPSRDDRARVRARTDPPPPSLN